MELSSGQEQGVDVVGRFLEDQEAWLARVTGYAGTGKTTLIRVLAEQFGHPQVLTPTGKAALRVTEATGLPSKTIHRFLYDSETDPKTGAPIFVLKSMYDFDYLADDGWVLVDEASMVSKKVWEHLSGVARRVGFPIVVMGDLFQLPPVCKGADEEGFSVLEVPTDFSVNLTEVHRQAMESAIVRSSMILRSNEPAFRALGLLRSVGETSLIDEAAAVRARGGAIICHTNARRHLLNDQLRDRAGLAPGTLHSGEPLLVTQNNYGLDRYNGEVVDFRGWVHPPDRQFVVRDRYTSSALEMNFGVGLVGLEGQEKTATLAIEEVSGKSEAAKIGAWNVRRAAKWACGGLYESEETPTHLHANYGDALTVHKAQGSEWPEVLVVLEDSFMRMPSHQQKRFLYTAITRAKVACSYAYVS